MREKHQLVASHTRPNGESDPQPRYVSRPGMEAPTSWCTRQRSSQVRDTRQGTHMYFSPVLFFVTHLINQSPATGASFLTKVILSGS